MHTADEIEVAIRMLSPVEREKLIKDLPVLLPELDGDMAWNRIIGDPRTRPGLSALLDQVEAEHKMNPAAFAEIKDKDFDLHSCSREGRPVSGSVTMNCHRKLRRRSARRVDLTKANEKLSSLLKPGDK